MGEEEKLAQFKLAEQLEEIRAKHQKQEGDSEQNIGFLRYKNMHSHIPPKHVEKETTIVNKPTVEPVVFEENKERESTYQAAIAPPIVNSHSNAMSSCQIKEYEIKMLQEKMRWKQKISEQEMELNRLKLQMMEQQNAQKT